jgi:hypothetical protein
MSEILTSLHGRRLGLDADGALVCPGGFVSGSHGSQFFAPSPSKAVLFDDFLGDVIADQWNTVVGTDTLPPSAAILAGGIGGVLRLTTGNDGTGLAADSVQLTQALQWQASNGNLVFEARLKLSAITTCWAFIGFTDLVTLEAPIISAASADTLTSNATDAVGFMFDTRMTTDNWWLVGVDTDVDATHQDTGFAPVADTYEKFRIEVGADGSAVFFRNGLQVGTKMTGAVTPAIDLTPTIGLSKTSVAASMTGDLDYVYVAMNR